MNPQRTSCCLAIVLATWATVGASAASAQDTLARAKNFYASAAYEEALQVLGHVSTPASPADADEVAAYQVFCLVALGRTDQAKQAIESLVRTDPTYHPSETEASPRVRTLFDETRRPLLPQIARQSYATAKDAFDHKDMAAATAEFDRAIALLDELVASNDPGAADLRVLAAGFRDLCKSTPPPAPAPVVPAAPAAEAPSQPPVADKDKADAPAASVSQPAPPTPDPSVVYGPQQTDVKPPVTISRDLPAWRPANAIEAKQTLVGVVEVVVAENGAVLSASMLKSILPRYDPLLLQATSSWKFQPATKDGVAVKYRLAMSIQLVRGAGR
jgi:tetratricopeptide (TPR) repeat protein